MRAHFSAALLRSLVILLSLAMLQACASGDQSVACPRASILADAQKITHFRAGGGKDLTDIEYELAIKDVTLTCDVDSKDVDISLDISVNAYRGQAGKTVNIRPRYFVAILTGDTVRQKKIFPFAVSFPASSRSVTFENRTEMSIPLAGRSAASYDVVVGFQLTGEELNYNRGR